MPCAKTPIPNAAMMTPFTTAAAAFHSKLRHRTYRVKPYTSASPRVGEERGRMSDQSSGRLHDKQHCIDDQDDNQNLLVFIAQRAQFFCFCLATGVHIQF